MPASPEQNRLAWLLADRSRYLILATLMDGRAKTAKELAYAARVTAQTASSHLGKLLSASIINVMRQGRYSYYRIHREDVARAIEAIMAVDGHGSTLGRHDQEELTPLQEARFCYDHLAGHFGVEILRRFLAKKYLSPHEGNYLVTARGETFFADLGLDLKASRMSRRIFACACMDWSERREHLGGALGAGIAHQMLAKRWIRRDSDSRAIVITSIGRAALKKSLALNWPAKR